MFISKLLFPEFFCNTTWRHYFQTETDRDKDLNFVKNILNMLNTLATKLDVSAERKDKLEQMQGLATALIEQIADTGTFEKDKVQLLVEWLALSST